MQVESLQDGLVSPQFVRQRAEALQDRLSWLGQYGALASDDGLAAYYHQGEGQDTRLRWALVPAREELWGGVRCKHTRCSVCCHISLFYHHGEGQDLWLRWALFHAMRVGRGYCIPCAQGRGGRLPHSGLRHGVVCW